MKKLIFSLIGLMMVAFLVWAEDERHSTVDRAIGGMEQGSRIQAPGRVPITDVHKTISSSQGTKKAGPSATTSIGENHGFIYSNPQQPATEETRPSETGTGGSPAGPINNPVNTGGSTETGGTSGTGGGTGPAETSGNPIVETDVNVDPGSGAVEADATVDTTGELEDKEIFDADLDAQEVASSESSNPIVGADADVNPESGTVETEAAVDTSGEIEEKQILDADVGAGDVAATETQVESATDITQSETVESADITTEPVLSTTPTSTVTAEVDTTGETTGGETDVGIEADVSGMSEGEDVTCDPSDGLLSSAACADLKL